MRLVPQAANAAHQKRNAARQTPVSYQRYWNTLQKHECKTRREITTQRTSHIRFL